MGEIINKEILVYFLENVYCKCSVQHGKFIEKYCYISTTRICKG